MNEERFFFIYYDKRKDAYTIYLLAGFLAYLPIIIIIAIFFFFNRQQLATHSWFSFLLFFSFISNLSFHFSSFLLALFFDIRIWTNLSLDTTFFSTFFLYNFLFNNCKLVMMGELGCFNQKMKFCPLLFISLCSLKRYRRGMWYNQKGGGKDYKDSLLNHLLTSSKASLGLS